MAGAAGQAPWSQALLASSPSRAPPPGMVAWTDPRRGTLCTALYICPTFLWQHVQTCMCKPLYCPEARACIYPACLRCTCQVGPRGQMPPSCMLCSPMSPLPAPSQPRLAPAGVLGAAFASSCGEEPCQEAVPQLLHSHLPVPPHLLCLVLDFLTSQAKTGLPLMPGTAEPASLWLAGGSAACGEGSWFSEGGQLAG